MNHFISTNSVIHLIGAAGSGMSSLSKLLSKLLKSNGLRLTGCDQQWDHDIDPPAHITNVQSSASISKLTDLVIYSAAVPADHPHRVQADSMGIESMSYPEFIGQLSNQRYTIAIAGSHGKSTTALMVSHILNQSGIATDSIIGAEMIETVSHEELRALLSNRAKPQCRKESQESKNQESEDEGPQDEPPALIIEACEYRKHFLNLHPNLAVILNIELDHFDCYQTEEQLLDAFIQFVKRIPKGGVLIVNSDCPNSCKVAEHADCWVYYFSCESDQANYKAAILGSINGCYGFHFESEYTATEFQLSILGRHNVANALAAAAVADFFDLSSEQINAGFESFPGVKRRLEYCGMVEVDENLDNQSQTADRSSTKAQTACTSYQVEVYNDYAHHPTEVVAALSSLRESYPSERMFCVFQSHQAIRTACLLDELALSLQNADYVIVADIFRARESLEQYQAVSAKDLASKVQALGTRTANYHNMDLIQQNLPLELRSNDVVVIMGAGDIWKVTDELLKRNRKFCSTG